MKVKTYSALVVRETENRKFICAIEELSTSSLPAGDVLIRVLYSSLNYKDILSASGNRGVTKKFPHTPGIDAAGIVEASNSENFHPGEEVIVTSYDLGMNTAGGLGQYGTGTGFMDSQKACENGPSRKHDIRYGGTYRRLVYS